MNFPISDGEWDAIDCPGCGENNLHQRGIEAFFREEDSPTGIHAIIDPLVQNINTKALQRPNPSSRRDGIKILFDCEHCHGTQTYVDGSVHGPHRSEFYEMHIVQHKGSTYIYWAEE